MDDNSPFDYIQDLPRNRDEKAALTNERRLDFPPPPRPRDPPTRPSHLKARQYFPTHPLLNISQKLPGKLTRQDWDRLEVQRILAKYDQWTRQNASN